MDVTLPNGVVIRGVPEGTTKEQIMEKAIASGLAAPEDFQQEEQPQERGILRKAADTALEGMAAVNRGVTQTADFLTTSPINAALELAGSERRVPTITDMLSSGTAGNFMEDGIGKDIVRTGGEVVAPGSAVGGALRRGARAVDEVPTAMRGTTSEGNPLGRLGGLRSQTEGTAAGAMRQMGSSTAGQDIAFSALAGAGAATGGEFGESFGGDTGREIGEVAGGFLAPVGAAVATATPQRLTTRTAKGLLKDSAPTIDNLKQASREVYREIDDLGATVNSDRVTGLARDLRRTIGSEGFNRRIHPKVNAALREFDQVVDTEQPLSNIDVLRRVASSAAQSVEPDEKRLGSIMVRKIDDFLEGLGPKDFVGGNPEKVGPLYRDARQLWQRARKAEVIADAMARADNQATGFENGLRVQFRSILNSKKKSAGFNQDELAAMRRVVKGGPIENTAKALGKFGFSENQAVRVLMPSLGIAGGAAVGGPAGAVSVPIIGQVSRGLSQKLTRNNAEMADQVVRAGRNGLNVAKAYIRNVPKSERRKEELAELLLRPDVSLSQLQKLSAKSPSARFIADSAYIASVLRKEAEQEPEDE